MVQSKFSKVFRHCTKKCYNDKDISLSERNIIKMLTNFKAEIETKLDKNKLGLGLVQIMTSINDFNYLLWRQGSWKQLLVAFGILIISLTGIDLLFTDNLFGLNHELIVEATIAITTQILQILFGVYLFFSLLAAIFFKRNESN